MKTIIVTGASRGIGLAIARWLVKEGHNVVVSARTKAPLEEFRAQYPDRVRVVEGDAADYSLGKKAVQVALNDFGSINGLVINHAVLAPVSHIANSSIEAWKSSFDVNVFSAIAWVEATIAELRKSQGSIVLTSSGAAVTGYSTWGAYSASKAALRSLGQTIASEEKDVTVFSIRPGVVDTEMQRELREAHGETMDQEVRETFLNLSKEGKLLKPEQPGHVMAKLALGGPKGLSGQLLTWNAPELESFQE